MKEEEIKEKLTLLCDDYFLGKLCEAARIYGWTGDFVEVREFIKTLYGIVDKKMPEVLPYDLIDDI